MGTQRNLSFTSTSYLYPRIQNTRLRCFRVSTWMQCRLPRVPFPFVASIMCIVMSKVQRSSRITSYIADAPAQRLLQPATLIPRSPKGPHQPEALTTPFQSLSSLTPLRQLATKDSGRIDWRQYNTNDTVGIDMCKHRGQFPIFKNKINIRRSQIEPFQILN
jgi:hypothetical protein